MSHKLLMKRLLLLAALMPTNCQRDGAAIAAETSAREDARAEPRTPGISNMMADDERPEEKQPAETEEEVPYTIEYIDHMLEKTFGDAARHTPEELKVIEFVESHVAADYIRAFPKPHRYLVNRENGLWVVNVMSLEALRTPGLRAGALVVHVRQGAKGFTVGKVGIKT